MGFTVNVECRECGHVIPDVECDPGVAPKWTLNPDDPAYSDPGDPGYFDCPEKCPDCGAVFDLFEEKRLAIEDYAERHEPDPDEAYDRWRDREWDRE